MIAERILAAARASFSAQGYATTTLRSVARAAEVDPSLVSYYFKSKKGLFEAALAPPDSFMEGVHKAAIAPPHERGTAIVTAMLGLWDDPAAAAVLQSIILTASHEASALERLRSLFSDQVLTAVAHSLSSTERDCRAGLVASQMVGLAMTRYVWRFGPMAELPSDRVVELIAPTIQRYLFDPLD
ncbi:TetR family transcriptional regulator [Streptomyces sp. NPDC029080]|uniref:TetR/AcrR family transcriptional regulator n=1 Tax=Streptomyces sp. NPDC029080 TaxID=3155017 RepID=UPI00340A4F3E